MIPQQPQGIQIHGLNVYQKPNKLWYAFGKIGDKQRTIYIGKCMLKAQDKIRAYCKKQGLDLPDGKTTSKKDLASLTKVTTIAKTSGVLEVGPVESLAEKEIKREIERQIQEANKEIRHDTACQISAVLEELSIEISKQTSHQLAELRKDFQEKLAKLASIVSVIANAQTNKKAKTTPNTIQPEKTLKTQISPDSWEILRKRINSAKTDTSLRQLAKLASISKSSLARFADGKQSTIKNKDQLAEALTRLGF